ncbi:MAG: lipoyl synthase [Bacteroidales bacterium]|jgi:lipoic acid synthetase|nr:lipoyl synthase [Bacteroidales bacterium]
MASRKKPDWLKIKLPEGKNYTAVNQIVKEHHLHTICESGKCPNIGECWGNSTATFMILGDICTRSCKFCNTKTGKPLPPDPNEPKELAEAIKLMKLKHAVITSVDRDDLEDKGAKHWADTVKAVRAINPKTTMETLIPDFDATPSLLDIIIEVKPEIVSHNLETVERLTPLVRSRAKYQSSLQVINYLSENGIRTKSGLMLGLGETNEEILKSMDDLVNAGCEILTLGQYLQPTANHLPVQRYLTPEEFELLKQAGFHAGLKQVESAPLVRSSYHADQQV